jgi:hypothetical protein
MPKRKWDGLVVDGAELRGKCGEKSCRKKEQPIFEFCPVDDRKKAAFDQAVEDYEIAATDGEVELASEHESAVRGLMKTRCAHHRALNAKSRTEGPNCSVAACKAAWEELQATKFAICGKCGATRAPEADHVDPKGLIDPKNKKVHIVSDYKWWACHGGVPALRAEAASKCEPICRMCHTIEETSSAGNRVRHPDTYAVVRNKDDKKVYEQRRKAQIKYPKMKYVDDVKRHLNGCAHLYCPGDGPKDWVHKHPQCGDWDHLDEVDKKICIAQIVNSTKKVSVAKWKAAIDKELRKCRLLCRNCHHCRTHKGLAIETIPLSQYLAKIEAAIAHATAQVAAI